MPCETHHGPNYPPKKSQEGEAAVLMTWLQRFLKEPVLTDTLTGAYPAEFAVADLCSKIRELGGWAFISTLRYEHRDNEDVNALAEWWKIHEWRDRMRARFSSQARLPA